MSLKMDEAHVLVLEDDQEVADLTVELLEMNGYVARHAPTVAAALESVQQSPPGCVLVDYDLTDGTGLDFVRQVQSRFGDELPMIAVSGWQQSDPAIEELAHLCNFYFCKPVDWIALQSALRQLLGVPAAIRN